MNNYGVFPNAPITEAVLDINTQLPQATDLKTLERLHEIIRERFPEKKERILVEGMLKLASDEKASSTGQRTHGYAFYSPIEKKVVQSRLDGFTFNKLKPYENWSTFRTEGRKLWESYAEIASPIKVMRISLRYINRIEVPLLMKDFKEYILTAPEIAPNLPQGVSHFFMRLEIPNPEIQATAIITETMEKPTRSQRLPLIIDIDVVRQAEYIVSSNMVKMWDDFEKLRNFKNDIFFNSITEKTKELFK